MFRLILIILFSIIHLEGYSDSKKKDQHKKPVLEKIPGVEKKPSYPYELATSLSKDELEIYKTLFNSSCYVETHSKTGETLILASAIFESVKGIENFSPSIFKFKKRGKKISNIKLHAGEPNEKIRELFIDAPNGTFFHNNYYSPEVIQEIFKIWKEKDVLLISDIERTKAYSPESSIQFSKWIKSLNPSLSVYYVGKNCLIFDTAFHENSITETMKAMTMAHLFSNTDSSISTLQNVLEAERFLSKEALPSKDFSNLKDYTFSNLYLGLNLIDNCHYAEAATLLKRVLSHPEFSHWRFSAYLAKALFLAGNASEAYLLFNQTYKLLNEEEQEIYRDLLTEEVFWALYAVEKKPSYSHEHVVSLSAKELDTYKDLFHSSCYVETHSKTGESLIRASSIYDSVHGIESFSPNLQKFKKLSANTSNIKFYIGEPKDLISELSIKAANGTFFHNNYYSPEAIQEIFKIWQKKDALLISDIERTASFSPESSIKFVEWIKSLNPSVSVYFVGKDCVILDPKVHGSFVSNRIKANTIVHLFQNHETSISKLKEALKAERFLSKYPLLSKDPSQLKDYSFSNLYLGLNLLETNQYKAALVPLKKIVNLPQFSHWRFSAYLTKALFLSGNSKEALLLFKKIYNPLRTEEKELYQEIVSEDLFWTLLSNS
jgi:hypothetical protein